MSLRDIMNGERARTGNYGNTDMEYNEPCPVCQSIIWDYLIEDKFGDVIGCDRCTAKRYP